MVPRTDWGKIATMIYAVIGNTPVEKTMRYTRGGHSLFFALLR